MASRALLLALLLALLGCPGGLELADDDDQADDDDDDQADNDDADDDQADDDDDDDAGASLAGVLSVELSCWQYPDEAGDCPLVVTIEAGHVAGAADCPAELLQVVDFAGVVDNDGTAGGVLAVDVDTWPIVGSWVGEASGAGFFGSVPWTDNGGCAFRAEWSAQQ